MSSIMEYYAMHKGPQTFQPNVDNLINISTAPMDKAVNTTPSNNVELQKVSSDESMQRPGEPQTKLRRSRTSFSTYQFVELEREFDINNYVGRNRRSIISTKLSLSPRTVKFWFQNRRMKDKQKTKQAGNNAQNVRNKSFQCSTYHSHDPALPKAKKRSHGTAFSPRGIPEPKVLQPSTPQQDKMTPVSVSEPSSFTLDIIEIIDRLAEESPGNSQNSSMCSLNTSFSNSSYNLNMTLESIKHDLEMSVQAWSEDNQNQQWINVPSTTPPPFSDPPAKVMKVNHAHMNPSDMYYNYNKSVNQ